MNIKSVYPVFICLVMNVGISASQQQAVARMRSGSTHRPIDARVFDPLVLSTIHVRHQLAPLTPTAKPHPGAIITYVQSPRLAVPVQPAKNHQPPKWSCLLACFSCKKGCC